MANNPRNPSAFPVHGGDGIDDPRNGVLTGGMTLRDWFAGQALSSCRLADDREQAEWVANCAYQLLMPCLRPATNQRTMHDCPAQLTEAERAKLTGIGRRLNACCHETPQSHRPTLAP